MQRALNNQAAANAEAAARDTFFAVQQGGYFYLLDPVIKMPKAEQDRKKINISAPERVYKILLHETVDIK